MREAGEDDVFQFIQLFTQRGVDTRMRVTKKIDPPGADTVEVAATVEIVKPGALATRNGNHRQGAVAADGVLLHLGAGVPDGRQTAS